MVCYETVKCDNTHDVIIIVQDLYLHQTHIIIITSFLYFIPSCVMDLRGHFLTVSLAMVVVNVEDVKTLP